MRKVVETHADDLPGTWDDGPEPQLADVHSRCRGADAYWRELQRSQLEYVCSSIAAATSLAENYVGLPLERLSRAAVAHG
jgi:hypothetical protein